MSQYAYALLGLTALVAGLVGILVFALARFVTAARAMRRQGRETGDRVFMTSAFEEAVARLKTQERAMTARAEESERLSDEIMASLTSGLLVVGLDGDVRVLNPAGARLLGLRETAGVPYRDLLVSARPLADLIQTCLAAGEGLPRRTVTIEHPDRTLYFGVNVSALRDGKGTLRGAICLFNDLTAIVSLEEQLRLKDSLARLGELTAGLAHQFRNGLATIHGYGRMIDPDKVAEQYRPYVQGIRDETDALGQVVTNFLSFARPATLALGPVDLRELSQRAADEIRDDVAAQGGSITLAGRFATAQGDHTLLRQALLNLLCNGLDACVQAGVRPALKIEGGGDESGGVASLSIIDNGPGIPVGARDRLFKPFFTTKPQGTGLGLAVVQKIIVSHDGRITVSATPDGGACFEIQLPVAQPASSPQP